MYEYKAKVIDIFLSNGIQLELDIDLGFNIHIIKTIKMYAVDTIFNKQQECIARLGQLIPIGTEVKVSTLKKDLGIIYLNNLNIRVQLIQERLATTV